MEPSATAPGTYRFSVFEADLATGLLRKRGRRVTLQDQPFQVLALLLQRPGEVVTREELQRALWPADTFVEFEHSVNTAISKLRQALGDSADNPRFIETLPRKGYRFIAPVEGLATPAPIAVAAPVPVPAVRRRASWWLAGAGLLVVAAGCTVWLLNRPGKATAAVPVPIPLTAYPGLEMIAEFRSRGGPGGILLGRPQAGQHRHLRQTNRRRCADPPHEGSVPGRFPCLVPGRTLDCFPASLVRREVRRIPHPRRRGGVERKLTDVLCRGRGLEWFGEGKMSWHPNGRWLVVSDRNTAQEPFALILVSVETGEKRKLTSPPGNLLGDAYPAVSPEGRAVAFTRAINALGGSDLYLLELSEGLSPVGEPKRITFWQRNTDEAAWWPDGNSILFASGAGTSNKALWQMAIRGGARRLGEPEPLPFGGETYYLMPAISRQGRVVYMQYVNHVHIWRLELGGSHRAEKLPMNSSRLDYAPQYSPDGQRIAFTSDRSGSHEIWVCEADGSNAVKLTSFGGPYLSTPAWSPDGRRIAFYARPGGVGEIDILSADGGKPERLRGAQNLWEAFSWSRDGKWIYFSSKRRGKNKNQVWKVPSGGGDAVQITKHGGARGVESPDGKFLYYLFDQVEGENAELRRVPLAGGEESRIVASVISDVFSVVERGIYFFSESENPSVRCFRFATRKVETVGKVEGIVRSGFSVSPDGRWLLYTATEGEIGQTDLMMVEKFR